MTRLHRHTGLRDYLVSFAALVVLTTLSLVVSFAPLGVFELVVALGIAGLKASVVSLFFMHLIEQRFANRIVVIVTGLLAALLVALTGADVATRTTFPRAVEPSLAPPAPPPHE